MLIDIRQFLIFGNSQVMHRNERRGHQKPNTAKFQSRVQPLKNKPFQRNSNNSNASLTRNPVTVKISNPIETTAVQNTQYRISTNDLRPPPNPNVSRYNVFHPSIFDQFQANWQKNKFASADTVSSDFSPSVPFLPSPPRILFDFLPIVHRAATASQYNNNNSNNSHIYNTNTNNNNNNDIVPAHSTVSTGTYVYFNTNKVPNVSSYVPNRSNEDNYSYYNIGNVKTDAVTPSPYISIKTTPIATTVFNTTYVNPKENIAPVVFPSMKSNDGIYDSSQSNSELNAKQIPVKMMLHYNQKNNGHYETKQNSDGEKNRPNYSEIVRSEVIDRDRLQTNQHNNRSTENRIPPKKTPTNVEEENSGESTDHKSEDDEDDQYYEHYYEPPVNKFADIVNPFADPDFDFDKFLDKFTSSIPPSSPSPSFSSKTNKNTTNARDIHKSNQRHTTESATLSLTRNYPNKSYKLSPFHNIPDDTNQMQYLGDMNGHRKVPINDKRYNGKGLNEYDSLRDRPYEQYDDDYYYDDDYEYDTTNDRPTKYSSDSGKWDAYDYAYDMKKVPNKEFTKQNATHFKTVRKEPIVVNMPTAVNVPTTVNAFPSTLRYRTTTTRQETTSNKYSVQTSTPTSNGRNTNRIERPITVRPNLRESYVVHSNRFTNRPTLLLSTMSNSTNNQRNKTKNLRHRDYVNRVESSTLGPESYDNLNLNTYNSSEQYDTSQYDPYYGLYDDGVDLYRDIDYGHNYNTANKQPTPSQQTVYRGTPATSAPQVEIVTQRKSTQYIQPASNYNNRPHVENNAYNGASNAATHSTNSGASNVASHDHGDVYELSVGHDYVDIDDVPIQNTHPGRQPVRGQNRNELTFDAVQPSTVATSSTTITTPRPQTTTTTSTTTQRTPTRGRGSAYHSTAGDTPATVNRGTPAASRSRPTLKPSTSIVSKATEFIDIYKYPPRRPETVYPTPQVDKTAAKCRKDVCLLPDCSCGGREIPGDMPVEQVPQIVLLTFDDSVNDLNKGLYSDLFEKGRVNPNGCPITATFYVSHEWTDYSQVQNLYVGGHEIASHTVSHSFGEQFSQKKWNREVAGQREILSAYGGVKLEDIRGMRAPFLSVGGNKMFKMLYDSNFTYDSSMPIYENKPPSWPYTLDYKIFHDCMIPPCPTRSYPGVWEVPMVMWQDLNGGRCSMGDACSNPSEADGVFKMLMKNFDRHYTSNRAPFGLFYHAAWFTQPHHKEGFIHFLDTINAMKDVYLITNWQAIQWVRDPTPLSRIANFQPFQCDYPNRPKRCNNPKVCNLWHKSGVRYMRTCQPCPDIYPWTGKTGIKSSRIDNDIDD